jgi:BMFP domain-containing protein YqiC
VFNTLLQAINQQLQTPKADFEKNIKALLEETISKLELVPAKELEYYVQRLNAAEARLAKLEQQQAATAQPPA